MLCDSQREQKHLITCSVIIENKVWERDREGETEGERDTHTETHRVVWGYKAIVREGKRQLKREWDNERQN